MSDSEASQARETAEAAGIGDTRAARRYFAKFDAITRHLVRVAGVMERDGRLSRADIAVIGSYVQALAASFQALSMKYLMTGRDTGVFFGSLAVDRVESGFPVFRELLTMANDAQQAARHLAGSDTPDVLKEKMIRRIVGDLEIPTRLQFAMSQRLYYEALAQGGPFFWTQNDPVALWLGENMDGRRRYLVHWAVYDSQVNLPVVYLMHIEDTGRDGLAADPARWARLQAHLMAQSVSGLKLLTIAQGIDTDFDDLHPKRLRRIHIGPMYSAAFTAQAGPLRDVLEQANSPEGEDWALVWTMEELESERVREERAGWFSKVEREIFALDPFAGRGAETGATRTERAVILPVRPYQVLAELNPAGFRSVTRYVVAPSGQVVVHR